MFLDKPELATEKQIAVLTKLLEPSQHSKIPTMARRQASQFLLVHRGHDWRQEPATDSQRAFLSKHGQWKDGLTKGDASDLISNLIAEFKKRKKRVSSAPVGK
jgi:hypothetical protein